MANDSIDVTMSLPPSEGDAPDEAIEIEKSNTTGKKELDPNFFDDFNYMSYWSDNERPMPKHMKAITDFIPRPQATHFDISTPEGRAGAIEHLSNPDNNLTTQRPAQLRILHLGGVEPGQPIRRRQPPKTHCNPPVAYPLAGESGAPSEGLAELDYDVHPALQHVDARANNAKARNNRHILLLCDGILLYLLYD
jgi:hypothetical protein